MKFTEEALLTLKLDGKPVKNELGELDTRLRETKTLFKDLEKGTKEWAAAKEEIKKLEAEIEKVRSTMGLAGMTVKQLQGYAGQLNKEIRDLTPGTEAYVAKTKELQQVNTRLQAVRDDTRAIHTEAEKGQGVWGRMKGYILGAFTFTAILEAGRLLIGFFKDAFDASKNLDTALSQFAANTGQEYVDSTGKLSKEMQFFKEEAKKVGNELGLTADQVVNAYQYMGSAKSDLIGNKEALAAVTKEAIALSQAARISLPDAAQVLGGAMNQFEAEAGDASEMINTMAASAQLGAHEISDVAAALKVSGTVAHANNVTFEETNAVMASLSKINLKGAEAGTQFRNVLLTLAAGAKDTNPQVVGLEKALENLGKKNLSTAELTKLFGKENVVAAQHLANHAGEVKEYTKAVTGTEAAYKMQADYLNSLDGQLDRTKAQFTNLASNLGDKFRPILTFIIKGFNDLVDWARATADGVGPLGVVFQGVRGYMAQVWDIIVQLYQAGKQLASFFTFGLSDSAADSGVALKILGTVLYSVVAVIRTVLTSIQTLIDGFKLMALAGRTAWEVLKGDMSVQEGIATIVIASNQMKEKMVKNFADIGQGYVKIWKDSATAIKDTTTVVNQETQKQEKAYTAQVEKLTKLYGETATKRILADAKAHKVAVDSLDEFAVAWIKKQNEKDNRLTDADKKEHERLVKLTKANAEEAEKQRLADLEAHYKTLAEKDKSDIEAIADEKTRKIGLLMWQFERDSEAINKRNVAEQEKRAAIEAGERALKQKITDLDAEYRKKKKEEDEKLAKETIERERKRLQDQQDTEFATSKAILERQLLDKNLSTKERARLELELQKLETDHKLANLKIRFDAAIATAQAEEKDTTQLKAQYDAEKLLLEAQYQEKIKQSDAQALEAKREKYLSYFTFLGDLLTGNHTAVLGFIQKQLDAQFASLDAEQQARVKLLDFIQKAMIAGLDVLRKLQEKELEKQLERNEIEKKDTLAKWEEKYKKGLVDKATYEIGVDRINKDFDQKQKDLAFRAWRRQKNIDIAAAIVNGALTALKSLATFGWPIGAVMAAASVVQTAIQIKAIKNTEPPVFKRGGFVNAGVPQGPGHERGGIKLVDNQTGEIRGEMEGGEPIMILSRKTYANNRKVIDRLLRSSLHQNGKPIYRDGGIFSDSPSQGDYQLFPEGGVLGGREGMDNSNGVGRQQEMETTTSGGDPGYWDTQAGETYLGQQPDYSGAYEAASVYDDTVGKSIELMQKIIDNTAPIAEMRDLMRNMTSMTADQNQKLDSINGNTQRAADKPPVTINQITQETAKIEQAQEQSTFRDR